MAACTTTPAQPTRAPAPSTEPEADMPPSGLGQRDDAATLGPYATDGPVMLLAHKSAEYSASVNSWLIEGPTEIGLVDAQMVIPEAEAVVELLKSRNKELAWVWITHAHPDHYAGLAVIAEAFPEVRLLARPQTANDAPQLRVRFDEPLQKFFPGLMAAPVELTPYEAQSLHVDGVEVRIESFVGGEHGFSTALSIPVLKAMLIADLVYNRVHPWLNEMDVDTLLAHVETLAQLEGIETFYPGHGEPFGKDYLPTYVQYVGDFLAEAEVATSPQDLVARVWRRYRDWRTMAGLRFSATAHMEARRRAEQGTAEVDG
ncbi:MBL fold metallo-hydrolase [Paraliomyxa miuraensis]|uniref:MBL fold metallo-hydrolase n=1 Tax=Paraliomyxa miuraensis TaxID=376150 RepID=UPI00224D0406|nr:MBL fold metallo-hydrolase [Paraliomyxa miuraensis]